MPTQVRPADETGTHGHNLHVGSSGRLETFVQRDGMKTVGELACGIVGVRRKTCSRRAVTDKLLKGRQSGALKAVDNI